MTTTTLDVRQGWTSCSSAPADAACPGRFLAQKRALSLGITDPRTEDAQAGSRIHSALAGTSEPQALALDERETFDACREIEKKLVLQYFGTTHGPMRVFRHERYWTRFPHKGAILCSSGEADAVFRADQKILLADYKCGSGDVPESPRNLQLRQLAVLLRGHFVTVDEIACVIIQPLHTHSPELCVYDKNDLIKSENEMFARIIASHDPNSPRIPGELQCQFCLAKTICAEYNRWAGASLPAPVSIVDVPIADWTPDQCAIAAGNLDRAQKWLDAVKTHLKERLAADPSSVPGYYLKEGAKRETITDPQALFERFDKIGGTLEQFMGTIAVGKTKLKTALSDLSGLRGKKLEEALRALTDGLVASKQDQPHLERKDTL